MRPQVISLSPPGEDPFSISDTKLLRRRSPACRPLLSRARGKPPAAIPPSVRPNSHLTKPHMAPASSRLERLIDRRALLKEAFFSLGIFYIRLIRILSWLVPCLASLFVPQVCGVLVDNSSNTIASCGWRNVSQFGLRRCSCYFR